MQKMIIIAVLLVSKNAFALPTGIVKPEDRFTVVAVLLMFAVMFLYLGVSSIRKKNIETALSISKDSIMVWGGIYCLVGGIMLFLGLAFGLFIWLTP